MFIIAMLVLYLWSLSTLFTGFTQGREVDPRCHKAKKVMMCGAKTKVGSFFYFDQESKQCLPFKTCVPSRQIYDVNENRFLSKKVCTYICEETKTISLRDEELRKTSSVKQRIEAGTFDVLIGPESLDMLFGVKRHDLKHYARMDALLHEDFEQKLSDYLYSNIRSQPLGNGRHQKGWMCGFPMDWQYCGSQVDTVIQWYYSHVHEKCIPFNYCLLPDNDNIYQNRFPNKKLCHKYCESKKTVSHPDTDTEHTV